MFGSAWTAGCPSCSMIPDTFNGSAIHLANHDVMLWAVSRAPPPTRSHYRTALSTTLIQPTRAVWTPSLACTTGLIVPRRDATRRASGGVGTMSTTISRETSLTHDANASTNLKFDSTDKN